MAKTTKIAGIDALFSPTKETAASPQSGSKTRTSAPQHDNNDNERARIDCELPAELKQQIKIHCVNNNLTITDFIIKAIKKQLKN
jgi:HSP20 family molecular chaperone IbpA